MTERHREIIVNNSKSHRRRRRRRRRTCDVCRVLQLSLAFMKYGRTIRPSTSTSGKENSLCCCCCSSLNSDCCRKQNKKERREEKGKQVVRSQVQSRTFFFWDRNLIIVCRQVGAFSSCARHRTTRDTVRRNTCKWISAAALHGDDVKKWLYCTASTGLITIKEFVSAFQYSFCWLHCTALISLCRAVNRASAHKKRTSKITHPWLCSLLLDDHIWW